MNESDMVINHVFFLSKHLVVMDSNGNFGNPPDGTCDKFCHSEICALYTNLRTLM